MISLDKHKKMRMTIAEGIALLEKRLLFLKTAKSSLSLFFHPHPYRWGVPATLKKHIC
jgi:hypothetical protein